MTENPDFNSPELVRRIAELDIEPRIPEYSLQWTPQIGQETQVAGFFPGGSVGIQHPLLQDLARLVATSSSCLLAQFPHHEDPKLNKDVRDRFLLAQARALAVSQSIIDYAREKPVLLGGKSIGGVLALTAATRLSERGILVPNVYMFGVPLKTLGDVMRHALEVYGRNGGVVHGFHAPDEYGTPEQIRDFLESTKCRFTFDAIQEGGHGLGYGDPGSLPISQSAIEEFRAAFTARLPQ